eukprot:4030438-Pyramimonas_sp.AAC.1
MAERCRDAFRSGNGATAKSKRAVTAPVLVRKTKRYIAIYHVLGGAAPRAARPCWGTAADYRDKKVTRLDGAPRVWEDIETDERGRAATDQLSSPWQ